MIKIRFKARIKEVNGSVITLEAFKIKEGDILGPEFDKHGKPTRLRRTASEEELVDISPDIKGKIVRCIIRS